MTAHNSPILLKIRSACLEEGVETFVYRTEWTGYLPFPLDHWIEVAGRSISTNLKFAEADLDQLEANGAIERIKTEGGSDFDKSVVFRLIADPSVG